MRLNTAEHLLLRSFLAISLLLVLPGCAHKGNWAPVHDRRWNTTYVQQAQRLPISQDSLTKDLHKRFKSIKKTSSLQDPSPLPSSVKSKQRWIWPAKGRILNYFSISKGKKGIDIAGKKGEKIYAVAEGKVVYSGHGLASYGNLLIIKHKQNFLTAYGNNLKNLVTEGQHVKAGEMIADMGLISAGVWGLHFEIRKQGKPVNPMEYLVQ